MHSLPLCSIHLYCDIGSAHETKTTYGIAHFLEHMIFQGNDSRNTKKWYQKYDDIGASFHAYTTKRYTCFYTKCHIQQSREVIKLFSRIVEPYSWSKKSIKKEAKIIRNEHEKRSNEMFYHSTNAFESQVFQHSSFSHPIDIYHDTPLEFSSSVLKQWHEWFYRPHRIVLSVVSNESFTFWINHLFHSPFVKPIHSVKLTENPSNSYMKPIQFHSSTVKTPSIQIHHDSRLNTAKILFGFRTIHQYSSDKYIMDLLTHILNCWTGRLFTIMREREKLVYVIYSTSNEEEYDGYFLVSADIKPVYITIFLKRLIDIFNELVRDGITKQEYENGKKRLSEYHIRNWENIDNFAKYNGHTYLLYEHHIPSIKIIPYQELIHTYYDSITINHIWSSIKKYFKTSNMVITINTPNLMSLEEIQEISKQFRST